MPSLFVSYSRKDKAFADRLVTDLVSASFDVWRDTERITPGTPNWERTIRDAIGSAAALVLVASPDALASEFVQGELSIARHHDLPVFPIWAAGDAWINCVPLDMLKVQYVDGRGDGYPLALAQLGQSLRSHVETPPDRLTIHLPAHDTLTFDLALYPTLESLLNKMYMFHLGQWYPAFTYGETWVLGNLDNRHLALPWDYLSGTLDKDTWGKKSPANYGIAPGDHWGVWDLTKVGGVGVAVRDTELADQLRSERSIYWLIDGFNRGRLRIMPEDESLAPFPTRFVMGMVGPLGQFGLSLFKKATAARLVFVEA